MCCNPQWNVSETHCWTSPPPLSLPGLSRRTQSGLTTPTGGNWTYLRLFRFGNSWFNHGKLVNWINYDLFPTQTKKKLFAVFMWEVEEVWEPFERDKEWLKGGLATWGSGYCCLKGWTEGRKLWWFTHEIPKRPEIIYWRHHSSGVVGSSLKRPPQEKSCKLRADVGKLNQ